MSILNLGSLKKKPQDHRQKEEKPVLLVMVADVVHDVIKMELDGRAVQITPDKGFLKKLLKSGAPAEDDMNTFLYLVGEGVNRITNPELYRDLKKLTK